MMDVPESPRSMASGITPASYTRVPSSQHCTVMVPRIRRSMTLTASEQRLIDLWERHIRLEFTDRDAVATVATMARQNYVNHVPVLTGGRGPDEMLEFYGRHFIPKMPADTQITPVCRTVGQGRVIDEMIFAFTHDTEMDWMLPGILPTGRRVEVPLVVVTQIASD